MKKVKDLLKSIREEAKIYDTLVTPRAPISAYLSEMETPEVEAGAYKPDQMGAIDWAKDAFTDWAVKRDVVNSETSMGKSISLNEDIDALDKATQYLEAEMLSDAVYGELKAALESGQPSGLLSAKWNQLVGVLESEDHKAAYAKVRSKGLSSLILGDMDLNFDKRDKSQLFEELILLRDKAIDSQAYYNQLAAEYEASAKKWLERHKISDYYTLKSLKEGFDFTNIDTYLYKLPGLMGSSASSMLSQAAGMVGGVVAGTAALAASAALAAGSGGVALPASIALAATAGSVYANAFSRSEESYAEVYLHYKDNVRSKAMSDKSMDETLANARIQLKEMGIDPIRMDNEKILDMLLTNKLSSGNTQFDKHKVDAINGLASLYSDNMALSGSDIVQTAIAVMPFGAIGKSVSGIKALGKTIRKGQKLAAATTGIPALIGSRIENAVLFGMTSPLVKMNAKTTLKSIREIGGKVLLTAAMEGAEEGTQYIKGLEYLAGEYDEDPNLLKSWFRNIGTQARSVYAAVTPFDPIYSTDALFMENFKGGALLGGLMTGLTVGVQEAANKATTGKTSIGRQLDANSFASALYADRLAEKDMFIKNMEYSRAARESSKATLDESFDMLLNMKLDGVDQASVLEEKARANRVLSQSDSRSNKKLAKANKIDPRTEDYDIFVALLEHYRERYKEGLTERDNLHSEITGLMSKADWSTINLPDGVDLMQYQAMSILKAKNEAFDRVMLRHKDDLDGLDKVLRATGIKTNKADIVQAKSALSKIYDELLSSMRIAKHDKLSYDQVGIPSIEAELEDVLEKQLYTDIDLARNLKEMEIMNGVYADGNSKNSAAKNKVEKYKAVSAQEVANQQSMLNEARGVPTPEAPSVEISPATVTSAQPAVKPATQPTPDVLPPPPADATLVPETGGVTRFTKESEIEPDDIIATREQAIASLQTASTDKVLLDAESELKNLYEYVRATPGVKPLRRGYDERSALMNLDDLGLIDDEKSLINQWIDLKDLKDRLEEAIIGDDKSEAARLTGLVQSAISEIAASKQAANEKELNELAAREKVALNEAKLALKPIETTEQAPPPNPSDKASTDSPELQGAPVTEVLGAPVPDIYPEVQPETLAQAAPDSNEPLVYNRSKDPHSHLMNYWVNRSTGQPFQGYESGFESSQSFSEVSAMPDFLDKSDVKFVIRDYTNPKGEVSKAIYAEFEYNGKKYVAAISDPVSLRNYVSRNNSHELTGLIISNLNALRSKIQDLSAGLKPGERVVPTLVERTRGRIINVKNEDGSPKNRNLTETAWINKDPMYITPETVLIGISTGARGGSVVRCGQLIFSGNGTSLGQAYWFIDERPILLNTRKLSQDPLVAELILSLITADPTRNFVNKDGGSTSFKPAKLLELIVNFGSHTAVNPNDSRLNQSQKDALSRKQFYTDETRLYLGNKIYSLSDVILNQSVRDEISTYITDNMHWNVDETAINQWYLGQSGFGKDNPFTGLKAWFEMNKLDKMVVLPGVLEFSMADAGLQREGDRVVLNKKYPKGLSMVGWYVRQGILLTDFGGYTDANLYVADVKVERISEEKALAKAIEVQEKIQETPTELLPKADELPDIGEAFRELGPLATVRPEHADSQLATESARQWLSATLGLTDDLIDIRDSVLDVLKSGMVVVGRSKLDSIQLSRLAPKGTEYHEGWHRVSNLLISERKRRLIYDKYNRRSKGNLSDKLLDEIFADTFMLFLLDSAPLIDFQVTNWFKKIANFIKVWSNVGNLTLAKLYYDINVGKYANATASRANIERFKSIYANSGPNFTMKGLSFKTINNTSTYNDVLDSLTYLFFFYNNIKEYNDIDKLSRDRQDGFARLKLLLSAWKTKLPDNDTIAEIYDKFDTVFAPALTTRLKAYNTSVFDKSSQEEMSEVDAGGADGVNIGLHTLASYEVSKRDNAPAEVKFFFLTVPSYIYKEDGTKTTEVEPNTGFPKFVDSRKAWNTVLIDLHDIESIDDLVVRVNKYAETSLFYAAIARKLLNLIERLNSNDAEVAAAAETSLTKLENTLRSHKHQFITGKISRNDAGLIEISIKDNTIDTKAIQYPKIWSASLFYNIGKAGIFHQTPTGAPEITEVGKEAFSKFISNFATLRRAFILNKGILRIKSGEFDLHDEANQNRAKKLIVEMLNSVGISIDVDTIDEVLKSGLYGDYHKLSSYQLLNNFMLNTNVYGGMLSVSNMLEGILNQVKFTRSNQIDMIDVFGKDNLVAKVRPIDLWSNRGWVKMLAQSYAKVHANADELRSLGADGNSLYLIAQNNFTTDQTRRLNTDAEYVSKLNSVVFNRGSLILSHINNAGNPLSVETFVNFKDETAFDTGRDYFLITDREDYLAKMAMIFENRIIFPTVADKKTYHMIKGVELPHERVSFSTAGDRLTATYGDSTLNQFMKYFDAEVAAIELAMRQIDDTLDDKGRHNPDWVAPERRVVNYHTGNEKYGPNGVHFRLITGLYYMANGKEHFVNFNDPSKTPALNLQIAKGWMLNPNVSNEVKKSFLSGTLSKTIAKEVQAAVDMGLITSNANNDIYSLQNVLFDQKLLNLRKAEYMKSSDPVIAGNAEGYAIYDMIADYTLNSIISLVEVEKIYSGDPAYYKYRWSKDGIIDMSIDKIKRLGALTSTGLNNRTDFGSVFVRPDYSVAELKDYEIGSRQLDVILQLFLDGNIYDFIRVYYGDNAIYKEDGSFRSIAELRANPEYLEAIDAATILAKREASGYTSGINVADASVYVSPTMYRDMMRMIGQWGTDVEDAFNILTDPKSSRLWESDPVLYKKVLKLSLKPLKYMAFGQRLSEIPGLGIPYFNKMALFPLFESIASGDMKPLYDRMMDPDNPLDMVMFNSAVKAGSVGAMDYYDKVTGLKLDLDVLSVEQMDAYSDEAVSDEGSRVANLNKLVVYRLDFENLRQQLSTDPHTNEDLMAGTQMLKVGLSNIHDNDMYGYYDKISGSNLKEQVFDTMNLLSNIGALGIRKEFFNTDNTVNKKALYDAFVKDAQESDANDNIISGLTIGQDGNPMIPLAACSDNGFVESRFISMINRRTIDINMPGGSFIQRSTFGLEASSQSVISDSMLNDGRRLNLINEDGSMDSIVSINLFKHIIPGYNEMTFSEAKAWLIDNNIIGVNSRPSAIGYRIPTQAIASLSALKFTDVLPEIMGDTIILPEEFTKLTGSDFDVDKLFVARYQYKDGVKIQLDHSLDPNLYQDEAALKNHLLDMYMAVLTTKGHGNELKISIDNATENVKAVLRDIESNRTSEPVRPFDIYSPHYQEDRKLEYTGGKAGIGPMALNNAHHVLTLLLNPLFLADLFTMLLGLIDTNKIYDDPTESTLKGGRILDWLSAMINGFVDIAKDPYIVRLNVNPWTYNMVTYLLRMGKGKLTFYFMSQPILKEMAEAVAKTKGKYGVDLTKTASQLEKAAIKGVLDKYDPTGSRIRHYRNLSDSQAANELSDLFSTYIDDNGKETSRTRELILAERDDMSNFRDELVRIYFAFEKLKAYADDLANLVKFSKVDTKKMGKSFIEQRDFLNGMLELASDSNFAFGEVSNFYNKSFLQTKTDNSIVLGSQIFAGELYRTSVGFTMYLDRVLDVMSRRKMAGKKLLNSLTKSMEASIKSEFFNDKLTERGLDVRNMLYGSRSIAKRLLAFKQLIYQGNYPDLLSAQGNISNDFLEYLLPNINSGETDPTTPDFVDTTALFTEDKVQADNLINYWLDLLDHDKAEVRRLAEDLIMYAFITSGDNSNANSFFNYVPNSWRVRSGYAEFTRSKLELTQYESGLSDMDMHDLFLNNWHDDQLVKPYRETAPVQNVEFQLDDRGRPIEHVSSFFSYDVFSSAHDRAIPVVIKGKRADRGASADDITPTSYKEVFVEGKLKMVPVFPPYIKVRIGKVNTPLNNLVYKLVGYIPELVKGKAQYFPVYSIVEKKGMKYKGHVITEYGRTDRLPFNSLPIKYDAVSSIKSGAIYNDIWSDNSIPLRYRELIMLEMNGVQPIEKLYLDDKMDDESIHDDVMLPEEPKAISAESERDTYSGHIDKLNENEIFVFGSNTEGRHGKGAALVARKFGAIYGVSSGPQGRTFAIITKDLTKQRHPSRTEDQIKSEISSLYDYANENPDKRFLVAYSGIGANLNAYSNDEMAEMFAFRSIPSNIIFESEFNKLVSRFENETSSLQKATSSESKEDGGIDFGDTFEKPSAYVNHSGGAVGADSAWGLIGEKYGVTSRHYYFGDKTPAGNTEISENDYAEGASKVAMAAKANYGYPYGKMKSNLLIRNWSQAKYADAVFAIGTIVNTGERLFPSIPGDTRVALQPAVSGGTGYAVEMAIQAGKPVYVFDQSRNQWYSNINGVWSKSDTPTLTPNFAGIGSRNLTKAGEQAINDVYEKTFTKLELTEDASGFNNEDEYPSDIKNKCKGK